MITLKIYYGEYFKKKHYGDYVRKHTMVITFRKKHIMVITFKSPSIHGCKTICDSKYLKPLCNLVLNFLLQSLFKCQFSIACGIWLIKIFYTTQITMEFKVPALSTLDVIVTGRVVCLLYMTFRSQRVQRKNRKCKQQTDWFLKVKN